MKKVTKTLGEMSFIEVYALYSQTDVNLGDTVEFIVDDICQYGYPQDCDEDWQGAKKGLSSWLLSESFEIDTDAIETYRKMMESVKKSDKMKHKGIRFTLLFDPKKDSDIVAYLSSFTADNQVEAAKEAIRKGMK